MVEVLYSFSVKTTTSCEGMGFVRRCEEAQEVAACRCQLLGGACATRLMMVARRRTVEVHSYKISYDGDGHCQTGQYQTIA